MAVSETTALTVEPRAAAGSRAVRRLRRAGGVPGVLYGGGEEPVAFQVDARLLRQALAHAGAVLDLRVGDSGAVPVVLKDAQRHPVDGRTLHVDMLRVRLDRPIEATVVVELAGVDEAPGVVEGGIVEQVTREVTVQALPTAIPDAIVYDASHMQMHDTVTLGAVTAPPGVTLVDDPEETVIATLSPPRLEIEASEEEIEEETELVGEAAAAAGEPAGEGAGEAGGGE